MAITWNSLTSNTNTGDGHSTQDTATDISPGANSLVWCCFVLGGYTGSGNPTITTGAGLTLGSWTFVDSMSAGTGKTVYAYMSQAGSSPGTGGLTIDAEATETWDSITWRVLQCAGHNPSDPVEQVSKLPHGNRSGVQEGPWDTAMQTGNGAFTLVFDIAASGIEPRTNWGSLGSRVTSDGTYYGRHGYAGTGQVDSYFGATMTGGSWGSAMGIEINVLPTGGGTGGGLDTVSYSAPVGKVDSLSWQHTISSGSNRILLVGIHQVTD